MGAFFTISNLNTSILTTKRKTIFDIRDAPDTVFAGYPARRISG
jgi:hypothetical protein